MSWKMLKQSVEMRGIGDTWHIVIWSIDNIKISIGVALSLHWSLVRISFGPHSYLFWIICFSEVIHLLCKKLNFWWEKNGSLKAFCYCRTAGWNIFKWPVTVTRQQLFTHLFLIIRIKVVPPHNHLNALLRGTTDGEPTVTTVSP